MPVNERFLAQNPRKVTLVSVRDGHTKDFVDDGASVTPDGAFPHGNRQHLLFALSKTHAQGGKNGPRVKSWVLAKDIEIGTVADAKIDPALAAAKLTDTACDGKSYAQLIEENKKKVEEADEKERKTLLAFAKRTLSLDDNALEALAALVNAKAAEAKAQTAKAKEKVA